MPPISNFTVAPDVVEFFGGESATHSLLVEKYCQAPCGVCGRPVRFDTDTPANVVVSIHDQGMGPIEIDLAHPHCSSSGVQPVPTAPARTGHLLVPAMTWLRHGDPAAVLVIAPRWPVRTAFGERDLADGFVTGLPAAGLTRLTAPHDPLDVIPGWVHVTYTSGHRITVSTGKGRTLYDGALPVLDGWAELIQVTEVLGVVVAAGLDLHDPDRHPIDDLHAAIARGDVSGFAVRADPNPRTDLTLSATAPLPRIPALPPDHNTRRRS